MLPFSTTIVLSLIEYFCVTILHVIYAYGHFSLEETLWSALGFIPILLTILLSRTAKKESVIVRGFYISMLIVSYMISYKLETLGMLIMVYFAGALMIALHSNRKLMLEYSIVSSVIITVMAIFQMETIDKVCPSQLYYIYMILYAFGMVTLVFMTNGIKNYKERMEEKNEEAQNALEAKSNFLANMSHEIRTPMNAICGMAQLLSEEDLGETENEYVETIQKSSEGLLSIINEILDFSKIDSGKMEINEDEYHFNSLIHDVLSIIEFRLRDKSVKLVTDISPNVPRVLIGDELRIRQILINLLNNAVNFTYKGSITLKIRWIQQGVGAGVMEVEVKDTGIGISDENMGKLFKAFGQIDTRKNRNVEGTGLGLAISKNLLELMGGGIWATSVPDYGSTFSFSLPQKVKDNRPSNYVNDHNLIVRQNDEFKISFKAPNARVMIVDDNKVNLQVAFEIMKRFGFEATTIDNGAEAVNRIEEHLITYDIIFMDHMMPFMDGVEATEKIRSLDSQYAKEIPIVALTANAIKGVERQFKEAGMNDYLSKPIHVNQLNDILKKWLPLEKQIRVVDGEEMKPVQSAKERTKDEMEEDLIGAVKGVNVENGIRNCGGSRGVYIRILQTFSSSNLSSGLDTYYEAQDWENYEVMAHSIKGACRNIGADVLADKAFKLETAGKQKDIEYIKKNHDSFSDEYKELISCITRAIIDNMTAAKLESN
ncbi:MAG: response regulator [Lachnospiraceae bacterium]|nr:response regulator [Lachnospiraceae bacterium]